MIKLRKARGSMMLLVVLTMGTLIAAGMMGLMFNRFLFERTRAQAKVDALALSLAGCINSGNRVAQINMLETASRELVYTDRENVEKCSEQECNFLAPLCHELLVETRQGHQLLEDEREKQLKSICFELQKESTKYNARADNSVPLSFCWLNVSEPHIESVSIGSITDTSSNIKSLNVISKLAACDRLGNFVDPKSNLFKGNINARLPFDADLNFRLSRLPANIDGYCAPPRNANPDAFVPLQFVIQNGQVSSGPSAEHLPEAVQITCSMDASLSPDKRGLIELNSVGVTNGDAARFP